MREGAKASVLYFALCVIGIGRRREDGGDEVVTPQLEYTETMGRRMGARVEEG
jgi:hypothetical protein